MPERKNLSIYLFAMLTIVLWSSAYVFTRVAVQHFSSQAIGVLRYLAASIALLVYVLVKRIPPPRLRDLPWFLIAGAAGFTLYVYTFNKGSETVTASASSLIIAAAPVITALLARVFLGERMGILSWVAVFLSFGGVAIITLRDGGFRLEAGTLWIIAAALLISSYNIFQRRLLKTYGPMQVTAYCIFGGTLLLLVFLPQSIPQLLAAPPLQVVNLVYMGVFPGAVAYLSWASALSRARRTSQVTSFMFLTPLVTTLMGYFFIAELPPVSAFVGGIFVLGGLLLMNHSKKQPAPATGDHTAPKENEPV